MNLRYLRYTLRYLLRLKVNAGLKVTLVTLFPLTGRAHMHIRAHTRALAPTCISHRNYRNVSNNGALKRNFCEKQRNDWRNFCFGSELT
jgi:23S rRNA-/tRNA-specific pseudouridylate synthase